MGGESQHFFPIPSSGTVSQPVAMSFYDHVSIPRQLFKILMPIAKINLIKSFRGEIQVLVLLETVWVEFLLC